MLEYPKEQDNVVFSLTVTSQRINNGILLSQVRMHKPERNVDLREDAVGCGQMKTIIIQTVNQLRA